MWTILSSCGDQCNFPCRLDITSPTEEGLFLSCVGELNGATSAGLRTDISSVGSGSASELVSFQIFATAFGACGLCWDSLRSFRHTDLEITRGTSEERPCVEDSLKAQWSLYVPPVQHSAIPRSVHTVYLCVLCGSENKAIISLYSIN